MTNRTADRAAFRPEDAEGLPADVLAQLNRSFSRVMSDASPRKERVRRVRETTALAREATLGHRRLRSDDD